MADVNVGLWVRMEAKPGKEADVEEFLKAREHSFPEGCKFNREDLYEEIRNRR